MRKPPGDERAKLKALIVELERSRAEGLPENGHGSDVRERRSLALYREDPEARPVPHDQRRPDRGALAGRLDGA